MRFHLCLRILECVLLVTFLIAVQGTGLTVISPSIATVDTDHLPILIQGNSDLTSSNGVVSGSGTEDDPFVIQGWIIDSTGTVGIDVRDTDAFLLIVDVVIHASEGGGGIALSGSSNVTIRASDVSGSFTGIHLDDCKDVLISNNTLRENGDAVMLNPNSDPNLCSWSVRVENNWITENDRGFVSGPSYNSSIVCNQIFLNSRAGIWLHTPTDTAIIENFIQSNGLGIYLEGTTRTIVIGNDIDSNQCQAAASGLANVWNGTYPLAGNFWSDYLGEDYFNGPGQDVAGSDGIGDTPYEVSTGEVDYYPLMVSSIAPNWTELDSIEVACETTMIEVGEEITLTATGLTETFIAIHELMFTWSVNNPLGALREAVLGESSVVRFTGLGPGQCVVSVTNGSVSTQVTLTIIDSWVTLDTDGDGIPDWWETDHGLNPLDPEDALADSDDDGLSVLMEYLYGTSPDASDTDGDGLSDGVEVIFSGTDPTIVDTDGNGVNDGLQFIAEGGYVAIVEMLPDNWIGMTISWSSYTLYARSNSSVIGVTFDKDKKTLSMNVSGPDGTVGGCVLMVPINLVGDSSNISISIDGDFLAFTVSEDGTYYTVNFTYQHSSHSLLADLAHSDAAVPDDDDPSETAVGYIAGIVVVATIAFIVAIILVRRWKAK